MIGIIDYGIGNLMNVANAIEKTGYRTLISSDIAELQKTDKLILPGVGAFGDSMKNLKEGGYIKLLTEWVNSDKYLLGICLGMQLLFDKSYEMGEHKGLSFIQGEIHPLDNSNLKVPHMGWNNLIINNQDKIVNGIGNSEYVYFVHSYYADKMQNDNLIAYAEYGVSVPAIVKSNKVYGMQFHPEKSSDVGRVLLKNFLEME